MTGKEAAELERKAALRAGSKWLVIDTIHVPSHCSDTWGLPPGSVLWVNAVYAADDPTFVFHAPKDYPRLGARIVEAANTLHRKAHIVRMRTQTTAMSLSEWDAMHRNEEDALKRIAIHKHKPWESGGILLAKIGGWVIDHLPPSSGDPNVDWLGEMVLDLVRLRKAKDYDTADALKREITLGAGAHLYITHDGIEFIDAKNWS